MLLLEMFWFSLQAYWDRLFSIRHSVLLVIREVCLKPFLQVNLPKRLYLTKALWNWGDFTRLSELATFLVWSFKKYRSWFIWGVVTMPKGNAEQPAWKQPVAYFPVSVFGPSTLAGKYRNRDCTQGSVQPSWTVPMLRANMPFFYPPSLDGVTHNDGVPLCFIVSKEFYWKVLSPVLLWAVYAVKIMLAYQEHLTLILEKTDVDWMSC